jgi:hypothetical protein
VIDIVVDENFVQTVPLAAVEDVVVAANEVLMGDGGHRD